MADSLYTCDELVTKLKEIDALMDDATTKASLDTGQSKHDFSQSIRTLREQWEKYAGMLQRQCPAVYTATFGPSVIRFGGRTCS